MKPAHIRKPTVFLRNSLAGKLTAEQREEFTGWLVDEKIPYRLASARLQKKWRIKASIQTVGYFYTHHVVPTRYAEARAEAETFGQLLEGNFDGPTIKRAKQLAFSALTDHNPDVATAKSLLKIVSDTARHELAREKLALDAEKFRQHIKDETEKGLEALHGELKHDPVALALFEQMRARVRQTLEARA